MKKLSVLRVLIRNCFFWPPARTEPDSTSKQQDFQVGKFAKKAASPRNWQFTVDLSSVESKTLEKEIMNLLLKHKDSWSENLRTLKAAHHTINLKERERFTRQHPYRTGQGN